MSTKKITSLVGAAAFAGILCFVLFTFHLTNLGSHANSSGYNVVGNKIIGPNGKAYLPYGFVLECLAYKDPYSSCSKSADSDSAKIQAIAGFWHGNTVRLQVAPENLLDQSPYDSKFMNLMDSEVKLANSLGLVVILSLQQEEYKGPIFETQQSVTFWQVMANYYKNNPDVFFDMYNEPAINPSNSGGVSNMWNIWQNGGTGSNGQTYVGYQTIVNTIRNTGANNIIIAEAPQTDSDLSGLPAHHLSGSNLAYGIETNLQSYSRTTTAWYNEWGQYKKTWPIMPEAFRDNQGGACDPNSPADVPAMLNYNYSIGIGSLYWTLESGIATTKANLTTPTTYAGHTTITCPQGLSSIDPNNTIGPGADLLAAFKRGTGTGSQPSPSVSFSSPQSGAAITGGSATITANASVSSGSIKSTVLKVNATTVKTCTAATCSYAWNTAALADGTYTLEADTTASDGLSDTTTETVTVTNGHPPSTPAGVKSPSQTTTSIGLAWNASTDTQYPASKLTYHVYRDGNHAGNSTTGSTSYTDKGLSPGTYYSYTVTASDPSNAVSAPSAAFTQKTQEPDCSKPAAPKNFAAKASGPTTVNLSWSAVADPSGSCVVTGYIVSRNSTPIAQPTGTSYSDTTATAATAYTYTVLAEVTGNIAGPASTVKVTTPQATQPDPGPTAPGNLQAQAVSSNQVDLNWSASTDKVTGIKQYNVLRNGSQVGTTTSTSFGDSGLNASTKYSYQVVAVSGGSKTTASSTVSVTTLSKSTSGGGQGSGGGNGTGSGSSQGTNGSGSSYANIPLLQGTTSVGSGSENGPSSSQGQAYTPGSTSSGSDNTPTSVPPQRKPGSTSFQKIAFIGGSIVVLAVAGGYVWLMLRRRSAPIAPGLYDPDLAAKIVTSDQYHDNDNDGPHYPTGGNV